MILLRRRARAVGVGALAVVAAAAVLAGCTSGGGSTPARSSAVSSTSTGPSTPASSPSGPGTSIVAPVSQGNVRVRTASSCPLMKQSFVQDTVGMRLARITVLRDNARVVGCRFYALQNSPLANSEHLPGPKQPAVEIRIERYPSATDANNAVARTADKGTNPQQHALSGSVTTVCFQARFDPQDKNQDWACGFSSGRSTVFVRVAQTSPALNTVLVTKKALSAL